MPQSPEHHERGREEPNPQTQTDLDKDIVVVKFGTKAITKSSGGPDLPLMRSHAEDIVYLADQGFKIIMITSGANHLGERILRRPENQAELREYLTTLPRDPKDKDGTARRKREERITKKITLMVGQTYLTRLLDKAFAHRGEEVVSTELYDKKERDLSLTLPGITRRAIIAINGTPLDPDGPMRDNDEVTKLVAQWVNAGQVLVLTNTPGVLDKNHQTIERIGVHWFDLSTLIHPDRDISTGGIGSKVRVSQALARKNPERRVAIAQSRPRVIIDFMDGDLPDGTWIGRKKTLEKHHG